MAGNMIKCCLAIITLIKIATIIIVAPRNVKASMLALAGADFDIACDITISPHIKVRHAVGSANALERRLVNITANTAKNGAMKQMRLRENLLTASMTASGTTLLLGGGVSPISSDVVHSSVVAPRGSK
jgi:hypothetical protein